jgi:hypothetical protein
VGRQGAGEEVVHRLPPLDGGEADDEIGRAQLPHLDHGEPVPERDVGGEVLGKGTADLLLQPGGFRKELAVDAAGAP